NDDINWTIVMEGQSSIFPIYEVAEENAPLWSFNCEVDDIYEDSFDKEHVKVLINTKHSAYEMIHYKSESFNEKFMNEIMSNAIASIIMSIRYKQTNNIIDLSSDCEKGSVL